jgi:hypothetical protein
MLVVLLGFAALTIDVGAMYNTRADLQNAADAAALAGASAYTTPRMSKARSSGSASDFGGVETAIRDRAQSIASLNHLLATKNTYLETPDITAGCLDIGSATSAINAAASAKTFNAVGVVLRREEGSENGPLQLFFASIFGKRQTNVSASAVAVFDDRVGGYDPEDPGAADIWPFTIHKDEFDRWLGLKTDEYEYDPDSDSVSKGADELAEVQLYPEKLASGNFAVLNIGTPNQGTPALTAQISGGVQPSDIEREIDTPTVSYVDGDGNPITHNITGNSGLKAALENSIHARIGDVVAIFLHDQVSENSGANAVYRTTGLRFVRVLDVNLNGKNKYLWVEPVTYTGPGLIMDPDAPSTNGAAGRIMLAR